MTTTRKPAMPTPAQEAAIRNYEFFCVGALLVLVLVTVQRGYGVWCVLPLLVGVGGIAGRWRSGPFMLLLTQLFLLSDVVTNLFLAGNFGHGSWLRGWRGDHQYLEDLVQAAAVLAYTAGHYRLQALVRSPLPADAVGGSARPTSPPGDRPSRRAVPGREIATLAVALLVCAALALLGWELLPDNRHDLGLSPTVWRTVLLAWIIGLALFIGAALIRNLFREHMTVAAARLFLQDTLWRETRGEQRQVNRWLAWDRLMQRRRKELQ